MMMNDGPRVTLRHAFTMALIRLAMRETTAADTHSRTRHTHTHTERDAKECFQDFGDDDTVRKSFYLLSAP